MLMVVAVVAAFVALVALTWRTILGALADHRHREAMRNLDLYYRRPSRPTTSFKQIITKVPASPGLASTPLAMKQSMDARRRADVMSYKLQQGGVAAVPDLARRDDRGLRRTLTSTRIRTPSPTKPIVHEPLNRPHYYYQEGPTASSSSRIPEMSPTAVTPFKDKRGRDSPLSVANGTDFKKPKLVDSPRLGKRRSLMRPTASSASQTRPLGTAKRSKSGTIPVVSNTADRIHFGNGSVASPPPTQASVHVQGTPSSIRAVGSVQNSVVDEDLFIEMPDDEGMPARAVSSSPVGQVSGIEDAVKVDDADWEGGGHIPEEFVADNLPHNNLFNNRRLSRLPVRPRSSDLDDMFDQEEIMLRFQRNDQELLDIIGTFQDKSKPAEARSVSPPTLAHETSLTVDVKSAATSTAPAPTSGFSQQPAATTVAPSLAPSTNTFGTSFAAPSSTIAAAQPTFAGFGTSGNPGTSMTPVVSAPTPGLLSTFGAPPGSSSAVPSTPSFTFGVSVAAAPAPPVFGEAGSSTPATSSFNFGVSSAPTPSATAAAAAPSAPSVNFGAASTPAASSTAVAAPAPGFSFGPASTTTLGTPAPAPAAAFGFGTTPAAAALPGASFNFEATSTPAAAPPAPSFNFGAAPIAPAAPPTSSFNFGAASTSAMAPPTSSFIFGATSTAAATGAPPSSSFGQVSTSAPGTSSFSFGGSSTPAPAVPHSSSFGGFGANSTSATSGFGATVSTMTASGVGGATFGNTAALAPASQAFANNAASGFAFNAAPQPVASGFFPTAAAAPPAFGGGFGSPGATSFGGVQSPTGATPLFSSGTSAKDRRRSSVRNRR